LRRQAEGTAQELEAQAPIGGKLVFGSIVSAKEVPPQGDDQIADRQRVALGRVYIGIGHVAPAEFGGH